MVQVEATGLEPELSARNQGRVGLTGFMNRWHDYTPVGFEAKCRLSFCAVGFLTVHMTDCRRKLAMRELSRRVSRRRRRVFHVAGAEQLETRELLTSQISGVAFHDTNDDGAFDSNEQGIAGVLVTLTGTTTEGDSVTRRYLTKADGSYSFGDLLAGVYEVVEEQPAAIADGKDQADVVGLVAGNDSYSNIELGDDTEVAGLNFGEGLIDAQHISPLWLLASSGKESFQRDMRATLEEEAGNTEFADAIRDGETELESDFAINAAPEADADAYSVQAGETLTIDAADGVLNNDSDPTNDAITAVLVNQPDNGTVNLSPDGSFTYDADVGFVGTDSFTYSANDGFKDSDPATVTITVENPNTFSVSESAVVDDVVGTVEPLTNLGEDVVFDWADASVDTRLRLLPDDHFSGEPDAPVVLIEYLDFACPACAAFHAGSVAQELRDSPDDYLVVYRYLPLSTFNDDFNIEAARAAEAASRQGLFVEMLDALLTNQGEWRGATDADAAIALFEGYGQTISGFSLSEFRTAFADPAVEDRVNRDANVAAELGFQGTPTFALDGVPLESNVTSAQLVAALQAADNAPFKINRFETDSQTAGEIVVQNAAALSAGSSEELSIEVRSSGSDSETLEVTVNVTG